MSIPLAINYDLTHSQVLINIGELSMRQEIGTKEGKYSVMAPENKL